MIRLLTERELEVLVALGRGASQKEIAANLGISIHTVRHHLRTARLKLGAGNNLQAGMLQRRREGNGSGSGGGSDWGGGKAK